MTRPVRTINEADTERDRERETGTQTDKHTRMTRQHAPLMMRAPYLQYGSLGDAMLVDLNEKGTHIHTLTLSRTLA